MTVDLDVNHDVAVLGAYGQDSVGAGWSVKTATSTLVARLHRRYAPHFGAEDVEHEVAVYLTRGGVLFATVHRLDGSDAPATAAQEIAFFFAGADLHPRG